MASLLRKLVSEQRVTPVAHRLLASCRGYASRPPVPYAELVVGDPREPALQCPSHRRARAKERDAGSAEHLQLGGAGVPKETYKNEQRVAVTPASCAALLKAGFRGVTVESGAGAAAGFFVRPPLQAASPTLRQPSSWLPAAHLCLQVDGELGRASVRAPNPRPEGEAWRGRRGMQSHTGSVDSGCFLTRQDEAYADAGARVAGASEALGSDVVLKVQPPSPAEVDQLKEHARCVCPVWHGMVERGTACCPVSWRQSTLCMRWSQRCAVSSVPRGVAVRACCLHARGGEARTGLENPLPCARRQVVECSGHRCLCRV